jgi:hypothetical protein
MDPSSASGADSVNKSELKSLALVVGAPRFELGTSCAQGRRATRLRYAPTCETSILAYFLDFPTGLTPYLILITICDASSPHAPKPRSVCSTRIM